MKNSKDYLSEANAVVEKIGVSEGIEKHKQGLKRRFPQFNDIDIENSWSGFISVSRNGKPVFGNLNGKIFYAGVYNGGGLGLSVLFGAAMIDSALNLKNSRIKLVENFPQANRLPPLPQIFALMKIKLDQIFGVDES